MGASSCVACGECVQACPTGALLPKSVLDDTGYRAAAPATGGRQRLPLLRRRLPGRLPRARRRDRGGGRARRAFQPGAALRQGALRLRLSAASGPADPAAGPHRPEGCGGLPRPAHRAREIPRSELGGGAGAGRRWPRPHSRPRGGRMRWPASARPRGRTRRPTCSRSWSAPASAPTMSTTAPGFATRPRSPRCWRGVGSGAVTAPFMAAAEAEVIVVIGARPTENHPVAATYLKEAASRGAALVTLDPRGSALDRHATRGGALPPGRDVPMLNAMIHTVIEEGLYDRQYVAAHTEDFDALRAHVAALTPEAMAPLCGVPAEQLRARGAHVRPAADRDDPLGHGHQPDDPRHRQYALPDRPGVALRPGRPAGHRAASAAWPEQRAGRVRCRADPDGVSRTTSPSTTSGAGASANSSGARRSTPSRA